MHAFFSCLIGATTEKLKNALTLAIGGVHTAEKGALHVRQAMPQHRIARLSLKALVVSTVAPKESTKQGMILTISW